MFKNLPRRRRLQRAKDELFTVMEDKYCELKDQGKSENEAVESFRIWKSGGACSRTGDFRLYE